MRHTILAALLAAAAPAAFAAPVPKEQLLKPPANADHFVVVSEAGKHGDEEDRDPAAHRAEYTGGPPHGPPDAAGTV